MNERDPKGYYKLLGVHPDAPIAVIRAAYKAQAKDLHPDRNHDKDTTKKFQALQEAFEIISDERLRRQYDSGSSTSTTESSPEEEQNAVFEPIVCSKCSAVSAQPRFKSFYTVYSYIIGARQVPQQGVFCSKCELKVALKASAITLLTGWWSIPGFFWTLEAIFHNITGGQNNEVDARLQGSQALYFAQTGKVDLARAVAKEALALMEKAASKKALSASARDMKEALNHLLSILPNTSKTVKLKRSNNRFAYQVVLIGVFASIVYGGVYLDNAQAERQEAARLERQGFERAQAAAIAAKKAAALKRLERPLPNSGIYKVASGISYKPDRSPPFKITNAPGANTFMKLVRASDGKEVMSIFIRAGQTIKISVPVGTYRIRLASGNIWYGEKIRFGPTTSYAALDKVFSFAVKGNLLEGNEVELTRVINGNLRQLPLSASDF